MKIGYARVSTEDQNLAPQLDQLRKDGCSRVFREKMTGKACSRPALAEALAILQPGDTLVVWKLDRLGRSLKHLTDILQDLEARGIGLRSLSDSIDTGTPSGRLMFHLLAAIAEFEAGLISERTKLGLQDARRQGRRLGRPARLGAQQLQHARRLRDEHQMSCADIAARLQVGRTTLWRAMTGAAKT